MGESTVLCVSPIELFAAKIAALLNRTAARDLFDIYNLQKSGIFGDEEKTILRKCAVLYSAMTAETTPDEFDLDQIDRLTSRQIKTDLLPVLRREEKFDYTKWQRQRFDDMSLDELEADAAAYEKEHPNDMKKRLPGFPIHNGERFRIRIQFTNMISNPAYLILRCLSCL